MRSSLVLSLSLSLAASCGLQEAVVADQPDTQTQNGALTWEQFRETKAFYEVATGVWIADGDTPFASEKQLREFYDLQVKSGQLIVNRVGSADDVWDATRRKNLTYCVSNGFGTRKAAVVSAMAAATAEWEAVADVKYVYDSTKDSSCTASQSGVIFDVNPVNVNGQYIARAFFPSNSRASRNVLIDNSAFTSSGDPTLTGVLRHELGHTLGFRHEHTRPEAGTCFEDNAWRALTTYDKASVMHYPQCNGITSWALALSPLDKQGAAALYGAPSGGGGAGGGGAGGTVTDTETGSVAQGASASFGPYSVLPGSQLTVSMTGTQDPDLYVRFGAAPTTSSYTCRPYLDGATESCTLTVPAGSTSVFVAVRGFTAASFTLSISRTPNGSTPPPPGGTPKTATVTGSVAANQQVTWPALQVLAGTTLSIAMSGSGDPDLYVRFGAAPTTATYSCRPYVNGATETCTLTVPAGQTQAFVMVRGYAAGTFTLNESWTAP